MAGEAARFELSGPFRVGMIWAQARDGAIGSAGDLPWHIPEDLAHFKAMTKGYAVLHGRKSYEALPQAVRPLPGRRNLVLTRDTAYQAPGAEVVHSLAQANESLGDGPLWVVGGGQVYADAMPCADVIVVTHIDIEVFGDTYAPQVDAQKWQVVRSSTTRTAVTGERFFICEYRPRTGRSRDILH